MMVLHGSPYSGDYPDTTWPGYTTFFYMFTEMWNRLQPCWQHLRDTLDYVGRNQLILQRGVPKVDLAIHLYTSPWRVVNRYSSTNLRDLGMSLDVAGLRRVRLLANGSAGYTYDYLSPDNLLAPQAIVNGSTLAPDGPAYKALIVLLNQTIIS